MKQTFLNIIFALLLASGAVEAWAQTTEDLGGYTFTIGTDAEGSYYVIDGTAALDALASFVNDGGNSFGKRFKQTADITYAHNTDWNSENSTENNFTAIGKFSAHDIETRPFAGTYDGGGFTISGIRIFKNGKSDADRCQGLFGYVYDSHSTVKNVTLADARITGYHYTGGIVGYLHWGTVSNCRVASNVAIHSMQSNAMGHGGVVGKNGSTVSDCFSAATVSTDCRYVGAIAGENLMGSLQRNIYIYTTCNGVGTDEYSSGDVSSNDGAVNASPNHFTETATSEYTIKTAKGWGVFCDLLDTESKGYFSGKTVKLDASIGVNRMAGSDHHDFTGTFDGGGKTLTVNYGSADSPISEKYAAPFRYVESGGVILNLEVTGTITTAAKFAAGIIGCQFGLVTIKNCRSSVVINSIFSGRDGNGTHGGLVAVRGDNGGAILHIEGCVFDGKILTTGTTTTTRCGGFVGFRYSNGGLYITNCIYAPKADANAVTDGATFARNNCDLTNCYYTQTLGSAQGKLRRSVTAGENVTVGHAGAATVYDVSDITAYKATGASGKNDPFIAGIVYDGVLYSASGEEVSLTLENSTGDAPGLGYHYSYIPSAGTLSGITSPYTLSMPNEDVTVSLGSLAPIDWATVNQGTKADPYMIYNKDQLQLLAYRVNGTHGETSSGYGDKYFRLGADIAFSYDANEGDDYAENYEAIGAYDGNGYHYFNGNFDGDGHTVSGIRIRKTDTDASDDRLGLFGYTYNANINDVHLIDAHIKGNSSIGGIVGYNDASTISGCTVTDSYFTTNGNCGTICGYNYGGTLGNNYYHYCTVNGTAVISGVGFQGADITYNDGAVPMPALIDSEDNTAAIATLATRGSEGLPTTYPVVLEGRTLYKDGSWNTLCLPFDVTISGSPLDGDDVDVRALSSFGFEDGKLTLMFTDKGAVTTMEAGKPYIIKWNATGANLTESDLVFPGVTIPSKYTSGDAITAALATAKSTTYYADFIGTFSPFASTERLLFDEHNPNNGACRCALRLANLNDDGFDGWYTDAALTTPVTTIPFAADGTVTLYTRANHPLVLGDVNGDGKVTPADAIMILYHYFGVTQTNFNLFAADVNHDTKITPADAIEALYIYFGASAGARSSSPTKGTTAPSDPE